MLRRLSLVFVAVFACSACSKSDLVYVSEDPLDFPKPYDLFGSTADLAGTSMDLGPSADLTGSYTCRGDDAPGKTYKLVMNALKLPGSSGSATYAYDYDGDGRMENQLKNLVTTIALAGLDVQTPLTDAVNSGQIINLVSVKSAATDTAACVGVALNQGKGVGFPKFDGTDSFTPSSPTWSALGGALAATQLKTTDSRSLSAAAEAKFELQISIGRGLVKLPLRGVHLEGVLQSSGSGWRVSSGVLHGAVAKKDIDDNVLPAIADQLTDLIHADPMSTTTQTIIGLFESKTEPVSVTKCMTVSRCCRLSPATCVILPEEVAKSPIGSVLAPDLEVLDDVGQWKPVAGGKKYNAMSVGLGFTAVSASY